jgi:hypothetical protein
LGSLGNQIGNNVIPQDNCVKNNVSEKFGQFAEQPACILSLFLSLFFSLSLFHSGRFDERKYVNADESSNSDQSDLNVIYSDHRFTI